MLVSNSRAHNFSAGPGCVPDSVLSEASQALECMQDVPLSILGVSHRSSTFTDIVDELESNLRELMGLPARFKCAFLQGGGSLQFSMIPMNFLRGQNLPAAYMDSGYWSHKAIPEAKLEGEVDVIWSARESGYQHLPTDSELPAEQDYAYLHYASNETVEGLQFFREPLCSERTPRICDMSSDFLARPVDLDQYSMIYAHAQKNLGPSGATICLIDEALLERCPANLHAMLDYRKHIKMASAYNTPPVFSIYVVLLVTRWLLDEVGGLEAMAALNQRKASMLYKVLDESSGFYQGHARERDRSLMNVTFNLANKALESNFIQEAESAGLYGLAGHRTLGGLRASIYNPVTETSVTALTEFMQDFSRRYA